jgi:cation:H+ antiporter
MTSSPALAVVFLLAAALSIAMSGVLVVRLERVAHRLDLSEAALGLLAALAADAPEIASSITALVHHDQGVGVGIIVGSNLFNLAALLGLAAVLSASLPISRALSLFEGVPALGLAVVTALFLAREMPAGLMLVLVAAITLPYIALAIRGPEGLDANSALGALLRRALQEETRELDEFVPPTRATNLDVAVALVAVAVVVGASGVMERTGTTLGDRLHLSAIIIGGLVLAAVTSIPNVVAAIYLARRRRPAALISEASNSNTLNVLLGMAIPAVLAGAHFSGSTDVMIGAFYASLTFVAYAAIWLVQGMRRSMGIIVILGYLCFVTVAVVA